MLYAYVIARYSYILKTRFNQKSTLCNAPRILKNIGFNRWNMNKIFNATSMDKLMSNGKIIDLTNNDSLELSYKKL